MHPDPTLCARETVLSKVVRGFLPISGDFLRVENSSLRVLLRAGLLVHYAIVASVVVTSFCCPLPGFRFTEVVEGTHSVLTLAVQLWHFKWMRNRVLLRQLTEEVTVLMVDPLQVNLGT